MKKNMSCGIICGNTLETNFGFNEADIGCIQLKMFLNSQFNGLIKNGVERFYTNCNIGLDLFCAEIAQNACNNQADLICIQPFENQAMKWPDNYRERFYLIHEKSAKSILLNKDYDIRYVYLSEKYIIEHSDIILIIKSDSDKFCLAAKYALTLGKEIYMIDSDSLTLTVIKSQLINQESKYC
ncbi:MAG: DUF1273 domain-containing protein [Clostridiales bacterium]|nr:DUF1273 domain-containing protein [Clostridiales bacterium]